MSQTIAIILRFHEAEADRFEYLFETEVYPLWEEFKMQGKFIAASLSLVVDGGEVIAGTREYLLHVEIPSPEEHDVFESHPQFVKFLEKARPMQPEKPRVWIGDTRFQIQASGFSGNRLLIHEGTRMVSALRHVALVVPDLRAAEEYYQPLFGMELIGREAQLDDGLWYTLPFDKSWDDAEAAGIELGMLALRQGAFVLALIQGEAPQGQVFAIGLNMPEEEIARVRAGLPADIAVLKDRPDSLSFRDRYQITWQIFVPGDEFRTTGDRANRWIPL